MLGVVENPTFTDADRLVKEVADEMGCGDTFVATPVGVFFGPDGTKAPGKTVPDPYFGGAGPDRTGCLECGCCMTGCRYGAKNTLVKNYLGLAESNGAQVIPMTTVKGFEQRPDGLWEVRTVRTGSWLRRDRRTYTAEHLILAAGTWGTQHLLFKMRDAGKLARLSKQLGVLTRTNSESIVGAATLQVSPESGPDPRGGDHVVDSSDRRTPTSSPPLRQGFQRDGAAADADDRRPGSRGHRCAAVEAVVGPGPRGSPRPPSDAQRPPVERAHTDRAGDAAPGQLDHHVHQARQARNPLVLQQAGTRRARTRPGSR